MAGETVTCRGLGLGGASGAPANPVTLRSLFAQPVSAAGRWLLPVAALTGVVAVWHGLAALDVVMPAHPGAVPLWRDAVALSFALPVGAVLGLVLGPWAAWGWLRHVPLGAAAAGVGGAGWAGAMVGLPVPLPAAWLGTTVLAVVAAIALLRRRYRAP